VIDRAALGQAFADAGYVADAELLTAVAMMRLLQRPLLLEGEAGVGKTEVAKALAAVERTELIRLQCYEGLDAQASLYEWNYQRQLLAIELLKGEQASLADKERARLRTRIERLRMLFEWSEIHHDELMKNWQLPRDRKQLEKVPPLP
jgi:MoxR-like ATPase